MGLTDIIDVLVFTRGDKSTITHTLDCLQSFGDFVRSKANLHKSNI